MAWSGYLDRWGYTPEQKLAWWKLAAKTRSRVKRCRFCAQPGKVVDHIKPHKGNVELLLDPNNVQILCTSCHNSKKQIIENAAEKKTIGADGFYED